MSTNLVLEVGNLQNIIAMVKALPSELVRVDIRGSAPHQARFVVIGDDSQYQSAMKHALEEINRLIDERKADWRMRDEVRCGVQRQYGRCHVYPELGSNIYGYDVVCRMTQNLGGGGRFHQRGDTLEDAIRTGLKIAETAGNTFTIPLDHYTDNLVPAELAQALLDKVIEKELPKEAAKPVPALRAVVQSLYQISVNEHHAAMESRSYGAPIEIGIDAGRAAMKAACRIIKDSGVDLGQLETYIESLTEEAAEAIMAEVDADHGECAVCCPVEFEGPMTAEEYEAVRQLEEAASMYVSLVPTPPSLELSVAVLGLLPALG